MTGTEFCVLILMVLFGSVAVEIAHDLIRDTIRDAIRMRRRHRIMARRGAR